MRIETTILFSLWVAATSCIFRIRKRGHGAIIKKRFSDAPFVLYDF